MAPLRKTTADCVYFMAHLLFGLFKLMFKTCKKEENLQIDNPSSSYLTEPRLSSLDKPK